MGGDEEYVTTVDAAGFASSNEQRVNAPLDNGAY